MTDEKVDALTPRKKRDNGAGERCRNELRRILEDGPQPARLVKAALLGQGFSGGTINNSYNKLKINSSFRGKGFGQQTMWSLLPLVEKEEVKTVVIPVTKIVKVYKKPAKKLPDNKKINHIQMAEKELKEVKKALIELGEALKNYATTRTV